MKRIQVSTSGVRNSLRITGNSPIPVTFRSSSSSKSKAIPDSTEAPTNEVNKPDPTRQPAAARKKTIAELDEELRMKLEERSGDGGAAGLELENGKPVAMKRGVKDNMFRLI